VINGIQPLDPAYRRDQLITHMLAVLADDDQVTKRLSTWEQDFLESVTAQWRARQALSEKQFETLERIYAEKTA
jgi:hypothetical protein